MHFFIRTKKILKSKKFYLSVFALITMFIIACGIYDFINFPNEIHIIAGKEENFNFNVPVVATISKNDKAVVNINKQNLDETLSINLDKPFSVWSDSECTMDMKLSFLGIPMKEVKVSVLPHTKVVPCGKIVGVKIKTDGIMVLGLGEVELSENERTAPCDGKIYSGDILLKANGIELTDKEKLIEVVEASQGNIKFEGKRNSVPFTEEITPAPDKETKKNKIGLWVRDSTQGIGTITYTDKETNTFAALGHGITDVDTKQIMKVKTGEIMPAEVSSVKKGDSGIPGELLGSVNKDTVIGEIKSNNNFGIYGKCEENNYTKDYFDGEEMPIALQNEIKEGNAYILANVEKDKTEKFSINIDSINHYNTDTSKSMVIEITDKRLIEKTNGIVQGMSGSPIIQDGKLIGAVTHVFVRDSLKGYGIFIENMIGKTKTECS